MLVLAALAGLEHARVGAAAADLVEVRFADLEGADRIALECEIQSTRVGIARRSSIRPFEPSGCADAGLCHGTAGVAHIYNRLAQASGDSALEEAARRYYVHTLDKHHPGEGPGGYRSYEPSPGSPWRDDTSFLTGVEGVGLALLAAIAGVDPAWDRVLLTALPPR